MSVIGMRTETMVPTPSRDRIFKAPPCSSASDREIAKPSPDPAWLFVSWFCTCSNGWPSLRKRLARNAAAGVFDGHRKRTARLARPHVNPAVLTSKFHRIGEKVQQDLLDRPPVCIDCDAVFDLGRHLDVLRSGADCDDAHSFGDQRAKIDGSRSSEKRPASIFDMSRMSLMTPSR